MLYITAHIYTPPHMHAQVPLSNMCACMYVCMSGYVYVYIHLYLCVYCCRRGVVIVSIYFATAIVF